MTNDQTQKEYTAELEINCTETQQTGIKENCVVKTAEQAPAEEYPLTKDISPSPAVLNGLGPIANAEVLLSKTTEQVLSRATEVLESTSNILLKLSEPKPARSKKDKDVVKTAELQLQFHGIEEIPHGTEMRSHYETTPNGVKNIIDTPILVKDIHYDIVTGKYSVILAFRATDEWKEIKIPLSFLGIPTKLKKLADDGIDIHASNAKHVMNFLRDFMKCNKLLLQGPLYKTICPHFGWNNFGFAGFYQNILLADTPINKSLMQSLKSQGDLKAWVDGLTPDLKSVAEINAAGETITKASKLRILLDISIASLLINPLSLECFIGHIYGPSLLDKSAALKVCASLFGKPSLGGYCYTANGDISEITSRLEALNSLPLLVSFIENVTAIYGSDKAIMLMTRGFSQKHLKQNCPVPQWQNTIISSGEKDLINPNSTPGICDRVVSIRSSHVSPIVHDYNAVTATVENNYGLIALPAIKYIKSNIESLSKLYSDYRDRIAITCKCSDKTAAIFAAVLTADYILCDIALNNESLFPDNNGLQPLEVEEIHPYIKTKDEGEFLDSIISIIKSYVLVNIDKFIDEYANDDKSKVNYIGTISRTTGRVKILKSKFTQLLAENNIQYDDVKQDLAENGILIKSADGKHYQTYSSVNNVSGYFVTLVVDGIPFDETGEGFEDEATPEDEELTEVEETLEDEELAEVEETLEDEELSTVEETYEVEETD